MDQQSYRLQVLEVQDVYSFIHLFNKHLSSVYHVPGMGLESLLSHLLNNELRST